MREIQFNSIACKHKRGIKCTKILFLFIFVAIGLFSYSQSYFYFENKLPSATDSSKLYSVFLLVRFDGSAIARIKAVSPQSGNSYITEFLTDSVEPAKNGEYKKRWLVPVVKDSVLYRTNHYKFFLPRFVMTRQKQRSNEYYSTSPTYTPVALEYKMRDGSWQPGSMIVNKEKTIDEVREEISKESSPQTVRAEEREHNFYVSLIAYLPEYTITNNYQNQLYRDRKLFFIAVAKTKDPEIGSATKTDIERIAETVHTLGRDLGIRVLTRTIIAEDFSKKSVQQAIAELKPSSKDIVIFYYTGHGFRYSNDTSRYPRMSFTENASSFVEDIDQNNLSVEEVYKQLLTKKARVTILISDCCNSDIGAISPQARFPSPQGYGRGNNQLNPKAYNALFFPPQRIGILSSASDKGQLAGTYRHEEGSIFTKHFNDDLFNTIYNGSGSGTYSWEDILLHAKQEASDAVAKIKASSCPCVQTPTFKISHLK